MHFDQLQAVFHHLNCIKYGDDYNLYEGQEENATVMKAFAVGTVPHKFTRRILKNNAKTGPLGSNLNENNSARTKSKICLATLSQDHHLKRTKKAD